MLPRHALIVDHVARSVTLVVRGTASVSDAITSAICDEVDAPALSPARSGAATASRQIEFCVDVPLFVFEAFAIVKVGNITHGSSRQSAAPPGMLL